MTCSKRVWLDLKPNTSDLTWLSLGCDLTWLDSRIGCDLTWLATPSIDLGLDLGLAINDLGLDLDLQKMTCLHLCIPPRVMASSTMGVKLGGVFGVLPTTHEKANAKQNDAAFYMCLTSRSDHSRCRWHTLLTHHSYFDCTGTNPKTPDLSLTPE